MGKDSSRGQKEGKIVVGIPARAELRKELEATFKPQFGIDMELLTARGPQNASRIASEYKAGVKYFDVFIGDRELMSHWSMTAWSSR